MKRKRRSEQIDDPQLCDLILTDANGRSIRVHKALLMDKSDYFARLLTENNLNEVQLDENYLIELIHYLYNHESDDRHRDGSQYLSLPQAESYNFEEDSSTSTTLDSSINNGDLEILMQLLALSRKYSFHQLYQSIMNEINYKLRPISVLMIYRCATEFSIEELRTSTRLMVLTWLPILQKTEAFLSLSEESIYDIFGTEAPDVDSECKLNALSAWWSHNKEADMTNLWVKLITCNHK